MITIVIIIITGGISFFAFQNNVLFDKLLFNPYLVKHKKQWYRLLSHSFVHGNWMHLLINMIVLFSFGQAIEYYFPNKLDNTIFNYLLLYFGGVIISSLPSLNKHKNNYNYNAVGASGGVSAVIFATIFFAPWTPLYLFGLIKIPGIIFGILYLAYSHFMQKKSDDNIGHEAHFAGAIYGFIYPLVMNPSLFSEFLYELKSGL